MCVYLNDKMSTMTKSVTFIYISYLAELMNDDYVSFKDFAR